MTQFGCFATQSDAATTDTSERHRVSTPARKASISRRSLDNDRASERKLGCEGCDGSIRHADTTVTYGFPDGR